MSVKVALAQFVGVEDRARNLQRIEELMARAADEGAKLVAFHELSTTVYWCYLRDDRYFHWAEPIPGPSTDRVSKAAVKYGLHVVFPLFERAGEQTFNTAALIEPARGVVQLYRKSHVPTSRQYADQRGGEESYYFTPGDTGFKIWKTDLGLNVGLLICYDRHFPEGARSYGLQDAHVVFVPTASYRKFIMEELWELELQAMAWQNTYYVAGINKTGPVYGESPDHVYPGRSVVADPEGKIVARAGDEEGVITAEIDPARVDKTREYLRFYEYRRPELYGLLTEGAR
ncbi:MAG TPA: nitrilase-related carbon-nitrogen hydrolase [Actinomycetes bacterium]|jgi:N-carbamoylputrescine amidase|nr:nitrilase-related carbon-nitrogen hydrolase [Actinomycetes bacterium]